MKKFLLLFGILMIIGITVFTVNNQFNGTEDNGISLLVPNGFEPEVYVKGEKKEKIKIWKEFSRLARANQITREIDINDVIRAQEETYRMRALAGKSRAGNLNLEWQFMGPDNIGGRTRALLFDKDNPNRVYTGGVAGGLWFSNNGGNSWQPYSKNDTFSGSGVVSIAQASNGDIYVGTGENFVGTGGTTNFTMGFVGSGIWKSTDGGNTFNLLASTKPTSVSTSSNFAFIPSLVAHPTDANTILAGTNKGLRLSVDGGSTWGTATTSAPLLNAQNIQDIEIDENGVVFAVANGSLYKGNINDKASYSSVMGVGGLPAFGFRRICVAISPSDNNYIYMIGCNNAGETNGIYRSTDQGANWSPIAPTTLPSSNFNPTGDQGDYDMDIAVHPTDKDRAYVGGQLNLYTYSASNNSWWPISRFIFNPAFDPFNVHVDHHKIVFHPNNPDHMFIGTDGGIHRTLNAREPYPNLPSYSDQNKGYGVAAFYGISAGIEGKMLGGTQDNRALYLNFEGNSPKEASRLNFIGDGGFTATSKTNPQALFITGNSGGQFGIVLRSSNGGGSFSRFYDSNIDCDDFSGGQCRGDGQPDAGAPFIPALTLWEQRTPDSLITDTNLAKFGEGRLYYAAYDGIWAAIDALNFGSNPIWFHVARKSTGLSSNNLNFTYSEISSDGDVLYAGTSGGELYRIDGLKDAIWEYHDNGTPTDPNDDEFFPDSAGITTTRIASFGGRFITEIAVDQNNPDLVVVTLGNYSNNSYVYKSTQATTAPFTSNLGTFNTIQGNLPRMPVYSVEIDYYNSSNIIVGTEMGMFSTVIGGNVWQVEAAGMPSVPVFNIRQSEVDELNKNCFAIYAGTYGRGIYMTKTLTPPDCEVPNSISDPIIVENEINLYPNPAKDNVTLTFSMENSSDVVLLIYDLQGRAVYNKALNNMAIGGNTVTIDVSDLPSGNYIVLLRTPSNQASKKLMITK